MLSESEIATFTQAFQILAPSGQIPPSTPPSLLRSLGQFPTEAEIQELLLSHPILDLQTILKLIDLEVVDEVDQIFQILAKNGVIGKEELLVAFKNLGIKVSEEEVEGIVRETGQITIQVFKELIAVKAE